VHAVRVAARIRRELQTDVDKVAGHYGEYKVLVDGEVVVDGGSLVVLGVMPSAKNAWHRCARLAAQPQP
jgi:hypothetical protein